MKVFVPEETAGVTNVKEVSLTTVKDVALIPE